MASVFLRGRVFFACVRLWDATAGKWRFKQVATGCRDRNAALGIAATLENASLDARAGVLSREKAVDLVNVVLRLAGLPLVESAPGTWDFARAMCEAEGLAVKSRAKYEAARLAFEGFAGSDRPLDSWTAGDFQRHYDLLLKKVSPGTANDHLRFWRSVFNRAQRLGIVRVNPVAGIDRKASEGSEKEAITRGDMVKLVRLLRKGKQRAWLALAWLGWHTGHRLQDLLDLLPGSFSEVAGVGWCVSFVPGKTGGRAVVLPVPDYVAGMVRRLGGFASLGVKGSNYNGKVSNEFVELLRAAGVDPLPVQQKSRIVHLKSFHSFRHSVSSRLAAAGVSGQVARLVTAHASEAVHRGYVHAEVLSLRDALRAARRK